MANNLNPIPILLVLLLFQNNGGGHGFRMPALHSLQLESMLDNVHSMIHTFEKLNGFAQAGGAASDMKKIMEIVEKIPL